MVRLPGMPRIGRRRGSILQTLRTGADKRVGKEVSPSGSAQGKTGEVKMMWRIKWGLWSIAFDICKRIAERFTMAMERINGRMARIIKEIEVKQNGKAA